MSSDPDRIAVPTNGRRPHPVTTAPPTEPSAEGDPVAPPGALPGGISPQQLMLGFGIVASLVAIAAGVARRRVRR
jgi:hypothetical protein